VHNRITARVAPSAAPRQTKGCPPGRLAKVAAGSAESAGACMFCRLIGSAISHKPDSYCNAPLATVFSRCHCGCRSPHGRRRPFTATNRPFPHYSKLNVSSDFMPVIVCRPADSTHVALQQRDQIKPKAGRGVQARFFPLSDLAIGRAQRVGRPRGNQPQDDVRAMALIDSRGQNHSGPRVSA
jgi:hypothetical protein